MEHAFKEHVILFYILDSRFKVGFEPCPSIHPLQRLSRPGQAFVSIEKIIGYHLIKSCPQAPGKFMPVTLQSRICFACEPFKCNIGMLTPGTGQIIIPNKINNDGCIFSVPLPEH